VTPRSRAWEEEEEEEEEEVEGLGHFFINPRRIITRLWAISFFLRAISRNYIIQLGHPDDEATP
jgi:hypothetical protein